MKNLLYIGNQLSQKGKTATTIDTLGTLFRSEGYHVISASKKHNKLYRLLDMLYCIFKHRKQSDYVLIDTYSTFNFYYAYLTSQLCRILKLKYIPILHGGNLPNRLKNNPKLSHAIFNNAYKNIAPSGYILSSFEGFGYDNLMFIPNTIELEKYPFKERTFDKVKLLWVRSFSEIYNPNLAIEVLYDLKNQGIDACLCMVGPDNDGSLQKAKAYAKKLGVEVVFTGKLEKKEWIALSEDYNMFINTTNFDNMPVSVIEAMALGLPVISTNVGGMPYLIAHGKEGILVVPNQAESFVKAIKELQSNPEQTIEMTKKARMKVEQFDWNMVKKQWFGVLM